MICEKTCVFPDENSDLQKCCKKLQPKWQCCKMLHPPLGSFPRCERKLPAASSRENIVVYAGFL